MAMETPQRNGHGTLVWEENFSGAALDENTWSIRQGPTRGCVHWYTDLPKNVRVEDGFLVIETLEKSVEEIIALAASCPDEAWPEKIRELGRPEKIREMGLGYTSARIHTKGKKPVLYGRLEGRMKLPTGQGLWPAFWTIGEDIGEAGWPACGEIDIFELVGGKGNAKDGFGDSETHCALHCRPEQRPKLNYIVLGDTRLEQGKYSDDFHIFTVDWTPEKITFFVDGKAIKEIGIADVPEFHKPHYVILNTAVGGWPEPPDETTVFPKKFIVDWIRYYR
ncbi:MAG: glycoside hydrolase family 16 protein [Oscillospiraceae bacterium]|jgi:beta-glucanase (GH16 family)|nr:glycoside hydrolase family 16 protein [Oscillospiraceae bacterium]